MEMTDLLKGAQQFAPDFFANYCVINGDILKLDEVQKMGCAEFGLRSRINMPIKLYRYFPNREEKNEKEKIVGILQKM